MTVIDNAVSRLKENWVMRSGTSSPFAIKQASSIDRSAIVKACTLLRDDTGLEFNFLAAFTAVDYWPEEPRFKLVYQLYSLTHHVFLGLNVPVPGDDARIDTLETVFPNANWHEREIYDMFGVTFEGHSDLRRIIMPHDWQRSSAA